MKVDLLALADQLQVVEEGVHATGLTSCMARSSMFEEIVLRLHSWSLPMKCLTLHCTP